MIVHGKDTDVKGRKEAPIYWLPIDIIYHILAKLPVKSILRFRSVCKSWKRLISEPTFINLQLVEARKMSSRILVVANRVRHPGTKTTMCLYSLEERNFMHELTLEGELPDQRRTVASRYDCDGLILLYSLTYIYLCNPATRETLLLPDFSRSEPIAMNSAQYIGLGLDSSTGLYKVVRMFYRKCSDFDGNVGCEIFTVGTKSWQQIDDPPSSPCQEYSASVNGIAYWMCFNDYVMPALLSFDFRNETFGMLGLPSAVKTTHTKYVMQHGERLWLVHVHSYHRKCDIWELRDGGSDPWIIVHTIDFHITNFELMLPQLTIHSGKCILLGNGERLQCFDIESKERVTILSVARNYLEGASEFCPSKYIETLVSPSAGAKKLPIYLECRW